MKLHRLLFRKLYARLEEANAKIKLLRGEIEQLRGRIQESDDAKVAARKAALATMIKTWRLNEMFAWRHKRLDYQKILAEYDNYNNTSESCFILCIKDSQVSIADKPAFPLEANPTRMGQFYYRIHIYSLFFQEVVNELPQIADLKLLLEMRDEPLNNDTVPTFSFQKKAGDVTILIPDPDFICYGFYNDVKYQDTIPYEQKIDKAVFVGSTSSSGNSVESVRARENPRIDAGLYFREDHRVDFRLPNLVQCLSEEAENLLRAMGFGHGSPTSWKDQFRYKFLISMDGNGATCSRVVISLKSNSVLLKYKSDSILFYFSTLIPWIHYIPISSHNDVGTLVDVELQHPGHYKKIQEQGHYFANDFLSKEMVVRYTGAILMEYLEILSHSASSLQLETSQSTNTIAIGGLAQISGYGEQRFMGHEGIGHKASKQTVIRFTLFPEPDIPLDEILYQPIDDDEQQEKRWCCGGEWCGDTQEDRRGLRGFRIRLNGPTAATYILHVNASFIDSTTLRLKGNLLEVVAADLLESFSVALHLQSQSL